MAASGYSSFEMQVSAALEEADAMMAEVRTFSKNSGNIADNAVKTHKTTVEKVENTNLADPNSKTVVKTGHCGEKSGKDAVKTVRNAVNAEKTLPSGKPRIISLASGSRANCTLIDAGGTRILIDFGLSCRMLGVFLKRYGLDISDIDAVFITHEHADHVYGLNTLFKKYSVPVHMTEPSFLAYTRRSGFEHRDKITVHEVEYQMEIGGFTVSSCEVCHDSAACVSYFVSGNGVSFCTCTDLGFMPERVFRHVSRAENIILESNHDVTLLETGEYPDDLKRRIRSRYGHLSNEQCDDVLIRLVGAGVKRILLGHVSPENNSPELALQAAIIALGNAGEQVDYIDVAPRLEPIFLLGE